MDRFAWQIYLDKEYCEDIRIERILFFTSAVVLLLCLLVHILLVRFCTVPGSTAVPPYDPRVLPVQGMIDPLLQRCHVLGAPT